METEQGYKDRINNICFKWQEHRRKLKIRKSKKQHSYKKGNQLYNPNGDK